MFYIHATLLTILYSFVLPVKIFLNFDCIEIATVIMILSSYTIDVILKTRGI